MFGGSDDHGGLSAGVQGTVLVRIRGGKVGGRGGREGMIRNDFERGGGRKKGGGEEGERGLSWIDFLPWPRSPFGLLPAAAPLPVCCVCVLEYGE